MSIPQPDLYTQKYKDISDEMLASIPKYTQKWTNHNPSDPGIVILEMLSWIMDTMLYRIDVIPEEMYVSFLRLVAGSAGLKDIESLLKKQSLDPHYTKILTLLEEVESGDKKSIEEIKSAVFTFLGSRFRAVTKEDFQILAIEATANSKDSQVKRAIVSAKGKKVEVIIVPNNWDDLLKHGNDPGYETLIKIVSDYLDPRRLIGTLVEVKRPVFTEIRMNMKVDFSPRVNDAKVKEEIKNRIRTFLDPFEGGDQGNGWAYGRPLTIYEIAHLVEDTNGVIKICTLTFDNNEDLEVKETEGFFDPIIESIESKVYNVIESEFDPKIYNHNLKGRI